MAPLISGDCLGEDRDLLYERRLQESQPKQIVFRGKEADRVLSKAVEMGVKGMKWGQRKGISDRKELLLLATSLGGDWTRKLNDALASGKNVFSSLKALADEASTRADTIQRIVEKSTRGVRGEMGATRQYDAIARYRKFADALRSGKGKESQEVGVKGMKWRQRKSESPAERRERAHELLAPSEGEIRSVKTLADKLRKKDPTDAEWLDDIHDVLTHEDPTYGKRPPGDAKQYLKDLSSSTLAKLPKNLVKFIRTGLVQKSRDEEDVEESFREFGVRGMKWGVHKPEEKPKGDGGPAKPVDKAADFLDSLAKSDGKHIVLLTGINGSGKSTIVKNLLGKFEAEEKDNRHEFSVGDKTVAVVGVYTPGKALSGPDTVPKEKLYSQLASKDFSDADIIVLDGQKFAHGKDFERIQDFAEKSGRSVKMLIADVSPETAFERTKSRGIAWHPTLSAIKKQRDKIFKTAKSLGDEHVRVVSTEPEKSVKESRFQEARKSGDKDLRNFGRVTKGLYRGGLPTAEGLKRLKSMGVTLVIDLHDSGIESEKKNVTQLGMNFLGIPWSTKHKGLPSMNQIRAFLEAIRKESKRGKVYVHCRQGRDRTGTMLALFRMMDQNWSLDRVFKEMKAYGYRDSRFPYLTKFVKSAAEQISGARSKESLRESSRSTLAKRSHIPQTKRKYGLTKTHEAEVAEAFGGKTSRNQNSAFDVYLPGKHVVEVKTIVEGKRDVITMHPQSLLTKKLEAFEHGYVPHTLVFDKRKGKEAVYYKEGLGSFRLGSMEKLDSLSEAKGFFTEFGIKGMKWGSKKGGEALDSLKKRLFSVRQADTGHDPTIKPMLDQASDLIRRSEKFGGAKGRRLLDKARSLISKAGSWKESREVGVKGMKWRVSKGEEELEGSGAKKAKELGLNRPAPKNEQEQQMADIIEKNGALWGGVGEGLVYFHDPKNSSTLAINLKKKEVTPEAVQVELTRNRKAYGIEEEESEEKKADILDIVSAHAEKAGLPTSKSFMKDVAKKWGKAAGRTDESGVKGMKWGQRKSPKVKLALTKTDKQDLKYGMAKLVVVKASSIIGAPHQQMEVSPQILEKHFRRIESGRGISPVIVYPSKKYPGKFRIYDGTHRLAALKRFFGSKESFPVLVMTKKGFNEIVRKNPHLKGRKRADILKAADTGLQEFGVKGMKWGVQKKSSEEPETWSGDDLPGLMSDAEKSISKGSPEESPLIRAIQNETIEENIYRGLMLEEDDPILQLKPGNEFDISPSSFSTNLLVAREYSRMEEKDSKAVLLAVHSTGEGQMHGIKLGGKVPGVEEEGLGEVLSGGRFRVVGVKDSKKLKTISLIQIGTWKKPRKESLREFGVKGMKWGVHKAKKPEEKNGKDSARKDSPLEGKPHVTILMGINGSGKSTLLKNFVKKYGIEEVEVDGEKWNVVSDGKNKALMLGNYSTDEHTNGGRYFIRGNFWQKFKAAVRAAKEIGAQNVIIEAKRLAYGKQHDKMVKTAEKNGVELRAVRVYTPPDVASKRVASRKERAHTTERSPEELGRQDKRVGKAFDRVSNRLTLTNDKDTDLSKEADKLGSFIFKTGKSEKLAASLREFGRPIFIDRLKPTRKLGYKVESGYSSTSRWEDA